MSTMIFTNARVVLPEGVREHVNVHCADGRIVAIRSANESASSDFEQVDLEGNYLAPGFIDLHLHGALGRDAMEGRAEAFRAICEYHATGGTTSLLLTTATAPLPEITKVLEAVREMGGTLPQVTGVHVEGPFISSSRAGAQRQDAIVEPNADDVSRLLEFRDVIRRITLAPEVRGAPEAIARFVNAGIGVSGGHSDAWEEEARAGFERGMRSVTHTFNCMSSIRRRNGERVAGLLEVALSEPEITCELIADGRHVGATLMKMLYRAKGADGICLVTDASAGAGLAEGTGFQLASRDCVVRDGACWLADGSALAGSAARMIDLVRVMVREVGVPLPEAIRMATLNPARALGLKSKGVIAPGADADLVVLSPELEVLATFAGLRPLGSLSRLAR